MVEDINLDQINNIFSLPEEAPIELSNEFGIISGINIVLLVAMLLLSLSYTIFTFVMQHQVKSMSANFITPVGKKMLIVSKIFVFSGILLTLFTILNIL